MPMPVMCLRCLRNMYDYDRIEPPVEDFDHYPLGGLTPAGQRAFRERWAWQSAWVPSICRECDRDHDHRETPGVLFRLKRWWATR